MFTSLSHSKRFRAALIGVVTFALAAIIPQIASAQAYVPVIDIKMETRFPEYVQKFDAYVKLFKEVMVTNSDSVRQVLAGNPQTERLWLPDNSLQGNPNGRLAQPKFGRCETRLTVDKPEAWNSTTSPWQRAYNTLDKNGDHVIPVTDEDPVSVNNSVSLSCLLQELVEWKKLSLFVQIHEFLVNYISDAQTSQLSQKLSSVVAGANIAASRRAIKRVEDDPNNPGNPTVTEISISGEQPDVYADDILKARGNLIAARVDKDTSNSYGYTGTFPDWQTDVAAAAREDAIRQTNDGLDTMAKDTSQTLVDAVNPLNAPLANSAGYDAYVDQGFNDPSSQWGGGWGTFLAVNGGDANSPLKAQTQIKMLQAEQFERLRGNLDREYVAGGGIIPTRSSSLGIQSDPFNDFHLSKIETPSAVSGNTLRGAAGLGDTFAQDPNVQTFGQERDPLENQSTDIMTGGLSNFDQTQMQTYVPNEQYLVAQLYDTMSWGYFDTQYDTRHWAQAAMLSIYDQMDYTTDYVTQQNITVDNAGTQTTEGDTNQI